jgi:hypothetical protein
LNQEHAGRRGLHVAGLAIEQAHAEIALDRLDAAAERGLAEVHALGGAREMALVGQRHQVAQALEVHRCLSMRLLH